MSHTKNKSGPPRFQVGNKVRVKYGVINPRLSRHPSGRLFTNAEPLPKLTSRTELLLGQFSAQLIV